MYLTKVTIEGNEQTGRIDISEHFAIGHDIERFHESVKKIGWAILSEHTTKPRVTRKYINNGRVIECTFNANKPEPCKNGNAVGRRNRNEQVKTI